VDGILDVSGHTVVVILQTKTTGKSQIEAIFRDSCQLPVFDPASPVKGTATRFSPRILKASAAPTASGIPEATTAKAPRLPVSKAAMCIEPPRPLQ
jgi:hypothetical protein